MNLLRLINPSLACIYCASKNCVLGIVKVEGCDESISHSKFKDKNIILLNYTIFLKISKSEMYDLEHL
jgi:hypothetical protein